MKNDNLVSFEDFKKGRIEAQGSECTSLVETEPEPPPTINHDLQFKLKHGNTKLEKLTIKLETHGTKEAINRNLILIVKRGRIESLLTHQALNALYHYKKDTLIIFESEVDYIERTVKAYVRRLRLRVAWLLIGNGFKEIWHSIRGTHPNPKKAMREAKVKQALKQRRKKGRR